GLQVHPERLVARDDVARGSRGAAHGHVVGADVDADAVGQRGGAGDVRAGEGALDDVVVGIHRDARRAATGRVPGDQGSGGGRRAADGIVRAIDINARLDIADGGRAGRVGADEVAFHQDLGVLATPGDAVAPVAGDDVSGRPPHGAVGLDLVDAADG